ncbi:Uncharacterized conserved protein YkwD, contains CAP (CSP/antigen 5/PR1) domain [Evansella caseinilytica]|uniref:Uncharacterized conserved protein YkwD, contains CAP (CSP/antigen 5/PR1) domain n=1 Tax=Evansella caseinilytica TaxID=1503961 RepID=A0A1H3MKG8_9BACI|nr:CAP domain-containing protein [Evansella caseinilytica]SDY77083.1 Uncharacterized conserved protein YkwD, contains CAP (CSP/antigen 5/PR1) domain [Evansella caseinilytica]
MRIVVAFLMGLIIVCSLIFYVEGWTDDEPSTSGEKIASEEAGTEEAADDREIAAQETDDLDEPEVEEVEEADGIHQFIGEGVERITEKFGEADRIDLTPYGYEWWIYNKNDVYLQFGVSEEKIVSVFTNDERADTAFFRVGDDYYKVNDHLQFQKEVPMGGNYVAHQFELSEEDMRIRPLASIGDVWVQVYFDTASDTVSSIRYTDQETLLLHKPYSIVYRGILPEAEPLSAEDWQLVQDGQALQILDLTNHIRERYGAQPLTWDEATAKVAYLHSEDMYRDEYFAHTSPTYGELKDRLAVESVVYELAAENIAANYPDAIEAVEGWLNSEGHRVNLLDERFTHLGVGVYRFYFTQNFITPW